MRRVQPLEGPLLEGVLYTSENILEFFSAGIRRKLKVFLPSIEDISGQERVRLRLVSMQVQLAQSIERECATQVCFTKSQMLIGAQTTPDLCAQRLLETIPLYHILVGSSFYADTLRERSEGLLRLGFPEIEQWQQRASDMLEKLLEELSSEGKAKMRLTSRRRRKRSSPNIDI